MRVVSASKEYIFEDDRPFQSCHASTIVALDNGRLLASWFGGTKEGAHDVDIWGSLRTENGWSEPVRIAGADVPLWNPVLDRDERGIITLYYKSGVKIPSWRTMVTASSDGGAIWSSPRELIEGDEGGRGPVKNKLIRLRDGTMAAPASVETKERWDAFVDLLADGGSTWTRTEFVPLRRIPKKESQTAADVRPAEEADAVMHKGVIQPTLWESEPGRVHMLLRTTEDTIFRSDSADSGRSWCQAYSTGLPNNNSGIDLVQTDNGSLALVYNPVSGRGGARTPLVVRFSSDNGMSWGGELVLEKEPGEYSYPAIVAEGDTLHITYTWNRERIAYWKLTVHG